MSGSCVGCGLDGGCAGSAGSSTAAEVSGRRVPTTKMLILVAGKAQVEHGFSAHARLMGVAAWGCRVIRALSEGLWRGFSGAPEGPCDCRGVLSAGQGVRGRPDLVIELLQRARADPAGRGGQGACDRRCEVRLEPAGAEGAGRGRAPARRPRALRAAGQARGGQRPQQVISGAERRPGSGPGGAVRGACYGPFRGPSRGSGRARPGGGRRGAPGPLGRAGCGAPDGGRKRVRSNGQVWLRRSRRARTGRAAAGRESARKGVTKRPGVRPRRVCGRRVKEWAAAA